MFEILEHLHNPLGCTKVVYDLPYLFSLFLSAGKITIANQILRVTSSHCRGNLQGSVKLYNSKQNKFDCCIFCVYMRVCHFPIGILGQVWYLIVSIPDLCSLTYFKDCNCGEQGIETSKILIMHKHSARVCQACNNG